MWYYRSKYCLQHRGLTYNEQQVIKGPKMTSFKPFKQKKQRSNLYKKTTNKRETLMNQINKQHPLNTRFRTKDNANKRSEFNILTGANLQFNLK